MKKYINLAILTLCMFLSSCVSDLSLGDGLLGSSKVELTNGSNYIDISSDADQHSFMNSITEKGFYFTRVIQGKEYTDRIKLDANEQMTYRIDRDIWNGLHVKVKAYFVELGHEFTTSENEFTVTINSTPSTVTNVRFEYDDASKVTGRIYISGTNFGSFSSLTALTCTKTDMPGEKKFTLESFSDTSAVFKYVYCNIATTGLRFVTPTTNTILPQNLVVDGCSIEVGDSTEYLGVPHKVAIYDGGQKVDSIGCLCDRNEMSTSNNYYDDSSTAAILIASTGAHSVQFYFTHKGKHVYFPSNQFNITSAWEEVGNTPYLADSNVRYGFNRCWWLTYDTYGAYFKLHSFDPATLTEKTYQVNCPDNRHRFQETYPCICSDGVYITEHISRDYTTEVSYWRVYKFNVNSGSIEKVCDFSEQERISEAFEKIGNNIYFTPGAYYHNVGVWNLSSSTVSSPFYFSFNKLTYVGNDGQYLYNLKAEDEYDDESKSLYRTSVSDGTESRLNFNVYESPTSASSWNGSRVIAANNRLYMSGLMRSCSLPNLSDKKYYGVPPSVLDRSVEIIPVGNNIYLKYYVDTDYSINENYEITFRHIYKIFKYVGK